MEGELQRIVGRNIRRLRLERGLSQEDLAAGIGVLGYETNLAWALAAALALWWGTVATRRLAGR